MLEIVFGESACGSLKIAQSYGEGKYCGSAVSVLIQNADGTAPTEKDIEAARLRAEEQARKDWKEAVPLGGKQQDVYCFELALSVGDISGDCIGTRRIEVIRRLISFYGSEDAGRQVEEKLRKTSTALPSLIQRYQNGEEIRVWYSHQPDELCGMYWLMAQLEPLGSKAAIYLVKLPSWQYGSEGDVFVRNAWGEVAPGEWGKYIPLQQQARPAFLTACAAKWRQLQKENAPLRVVINGRIHSVSEDFYDRFILEEIAALPDEFKMAVVIGNVLGKYQLGIGDSWIAMRIERMIGDGMLQVVQEAPHEGLGYHRILRKR